MNYYLALIGAGFIGVCVALEPAVNAALGKVITPRLATFHSFLVGIIVMFIINMTSGGFAQYKNIIKAQPYLWFGGLLGASIVYFGAKVAPVIGVASMVAIMVAVQLATGIIIDAMDLFGTGRIPLDAGRVIGIILLIAGARLILR